MCGGSLDPYLYGREREGEKPDPNKAYIKHR